MGSSSSSQATVKQVQPIASTSETSNKRIELRTPRTQTSTPLSPTPRPTVNRNRQTMPSPALTPSSVRPAVNNQQKNQSAAAGNQDANAGEEIVFETFHHRNGKTFCCIYTNGMRFYLDSFETGEWIEFPFQWYDEGTLVVDEIESMEGFMESSKNKASDNRRKQHKKSSRNEGDDREGIINIPGKGSLQTYVFQYRRNIHCYFDPEEGAWIKLPIVWELATNLARSALKKVKDVLPQWKDDFDILSTLRACNYNVEDTITNFHATNITSGKDGQSVSSRSIPLNTASTEALEKKVKDYEKKLKDLIDLVKREREHKEYYKRKVRELEEQLAMTRSECQSTALRLNMLESQRPKTPLVKKTDESSVRRETLLQLQTQLKHLHKQQFQIKLEIDTDNKEFLMQMDKALSAMKLLKQTESSQSSEVEELRTLYRKEALQRKLLYNQLQELRGNIRVFCRCRFDPVAEGSLAFPSDQDLIVSDPTRKSFQFDRSFSPKSTQEEVFKEVLPIITSCVDGYNICILAYGQTGSGKTYTMQGPPNDPGVNTRAIAQLLRICSERDKVEYRLTLSMVEIYNETIHDLLSSSVTSLELRSQGNRVMLPGLTECPVKSVRDIDSIMKLGESNRTVAFTKMNAHSSRSHLLVMLVVTGRDKVSGSMTRGQLTMCDLAGSERVSKTEAQGTRLTEAAFINKSLTALGQVFTALRLNQLHVPYRNSKLTHLLQSSLGGDAKACLFVNVSPDSKNNAETLSTLQFGVNARQVSLGQAKQNISKRS